MITLTVVFTKKKHCVVLNYLIYFDTLHSVLQYHEINFFLYFKIERQRRYAFRQLFQEVRIKIMAE